MQLLGHPYTAKQQVSRTRSSLQPHPYSHYLQSYAFGMLDTIILTADLKIKFLFLPNQKDEQNNNNNQSKNEQRHSQTLVTICTVWNPTANKSRFSQSVPPSPNLCNIKATKNKPGMVCKTLTSTKDCFSRGSLIIFMKNRIFTEIIATCN